MTAPAAQTPDYADFLSWESKHRARSGIKALRPYFEMEGMISFGGGYPHPSTWPVNGMTLSVPFAAESVFVPGFGVPSPDKLLPLESYTPLPADAPLASTLAVELQYGKTYGAPNLVAWLKEHVQRVHSPPTTGWELLVTAGNTDGSDGILRSMLDKGDSVLVEEFAYPGLLCAAASQGKPCVGVTMDQEGILPQALEEVMAGWDEEARGSRKPKLLLMVTTCSNPTGCTIPETRKRELYAVCRKWNLIIVEDDPYCFLQIRPDGPQSPIVPSFLSMDVDGRVIRLDSFSKIVAPGSRVGWLVGPKPIVDAIMNRSEASTQCPSGFSVSAISAVLRAWGSHAGFETRYLLYISKIYEDRCLAMVRFFTAHLPAQAAEWPAPSGGMFIWVRIKAENHPDIGTLSPEDIAERVFQRCIDNLVLMVPSSYFKAEGGKALTKDEEARRIFFRVCYATPTMEELEEGVRRFAAALKAEFRL